MEKHFHCFSSQTLARYARWLPGEAQHLHAPLPVVCDMPWLRAALGLPNLIVLFSGAWPERGAHLPTGSFKDLEAATVLARLRLAPQAIVTLASAGNTAAAFAVAATEQRRRCVIVLTEAARTQVALPVPAGETVQVISITGATARYDDAIQLSQFLARRQPYVLEGGIRNIARRDGVGAAYLVAVEHLGTQPDIYVQAIGSAAGPVATHDIAARLLHAGVGHRLPRLFLSQNAPYTPVTRSWNRRSHRLLQEDAQTARAQIAQIDAGVLSNLQPPYHIRGGIRAVLAATHGTCVAVPNHAIEKTTAEFFEREKIYLDPAAAVALASLQQFSDTGESSDAHIVLHLTGGRQLRNFFGFPLTATHTISIEDVYNENAQMRLEQSLASILKQ